MKKLEYTMRFTTPAFLGNADQSGQWRTPPFKALLRQWWRVVYASERVFRVSIPDMRREEGLLFGHAWLENDQDRKGRAVSSRKSLVRIRLDSWAEGRLKQNQWKSLAGISHPEVPKAVTADLYLGYGPVRPKGALQPTLKANAAIQPDENAKLSIALPATHANAELTRILESNGSRIKQALWLIDRYGALGGRSRNGWGSFVLAPVDAESALDADLDRFCRPWREALDPGWDWPHAIGRDEKGPLIWQTARAYDDWKMVMRDLAIIKIGLRTQFIFTSGHTAALPEARHWLSYPVTEHNVKAWREKGRGDFRLPNSLRFKIRPDADSGKLRGVIFHVPCLPPPEFQPDRKAIESTWERVHRLLDHLRADSDRHYRMIADNVRRNKLKTQLDTVTLERISE